MSRRPIARLLNAASLMFGLIAAQTLSAAITFDAASSAIFQQPATASISVAHTVGTGSNPILIVGVSIERTDSVVINGVTYGGTALVNIGNSDTSGNRMRVSLWQLVNPPSGTANVVVTPSNTNADLLVGAVSYFGVHQTAPTGTFASGTGNNGTPTVNVSSAPNELVVDVVAVGGALLGQTISSGAGQTQRYNATTADPVLGAGTIGASSSEPGAATVTMSWTQNGLLDGPWAISAVPLKPALPTITLVKSAKVFSDPFNKTSNPKAIPGAFVNYTILVSNSGPGSVDANTVILTDAVPANTDLFVGDLGEAGSGPLTFTDGAPSSGLTYTFTSLSSTADELSFSNDGGATYNYTPVPDANAVDPSVTHIRINPTGSFNANSNFQVVFRVRVE